MNKIISIGQAAKLLGVHVQTLRNWEKSGKLKPDSISPGGTRRYNSDTIMRISGKELPQIEKDDRVTIAYARVSSQDQKEELKRQAQVLELYAETVVVGESQTCSGIMPASVEGYLLTVFTYV